MQKKFPKLKTVAKAGVIYVMEKAAEHGFDSRDPEWVNFGQGAPETGIILNSPARIEQINIINHNQGYAPVPGLYELRNKVASLYNDLFRQNKTSQYTCKNVIIAGGGRLIISRILAAIGKINLGYFLPDYASYEGIMSVFGNIKPIALKLPVNKGFQLNIVELKKNIKKHKIQAILLSNPSNPTGNVIAEDNLQKLVKLARDLGFILILDEFYFNYIYNSENGFISASEYINDVDSDPVIIVSGLTKAWRYPGWRVCWAMGPQEIMESISSVGSFLDGGANNPLQKAAVALINKKNFQAETRAIQVEYRKKRDYMVQRLLSLGIKIDNNPEGAFYIWANLSNLPVKINDGMKFLEACLIEKAIVVPGIFFDLNPRGRRKKRNFQNYVRFSYGPSMEKIKIGMNAIERVIKKYS
ncbi:MAG: pyridoxal phosphate-dependent aminotransferase [Patescibacteria group bacterium]|nr:pyridoxal phosphate-dependent aminotransferase [Patescibacteria group bacterium]